MENNGGILDGQDQTTVEENVGTALYLPAEIATSYSPGV